MDALTYLVMKPRGNEIDAMPLSQSSGRLPAGFEPVRPLDPENPENREDP